MAGYVPRDIEEDPDLEFSTTFKNNILNSKKKRGKQ